MEIIAGDIGGTKSWLASATTQGRIITRINYEHVYASNDFRSAEALLSQFMQDAHLSRVDAACLALPGPVTRHKPIHLTNLDWVLERAPLQTLLGTHDVYFLNDFQAAAEGVASLTPAEYIELNPKAESSENGTRVITGAGTGLGLAFMQADIRGRYYTYATEGGHTDFAPANAQQERLLLFMRQSFKHVSWERLLSGAGVNACYQFCLQDLTNTLPETLKHLNGAEIYQQAQSGDTISRAALQLFADVYANWVGNLALLYQPSGGLYIGGGISARLTEWLTTERFLQMAMDKGRLSRIVQQTPIYLITNMRLGLQGALMAAINHHCD